MQKSMLYFHPEMTKILKAQTSLNRIVGIVGIRPISHINSLVFFLSNFRLYVHSVFLWCALNDIDLVS